ncbi:hypothetical protein [Sphaerotilus sp.]|nr:hypothetical protein [Sphaerotilus sp.]
MKRRIPSTAALTEFDATIYAGDSHWPGCSAKAICADRATSSSR